LPPSRTRRQVRQAPRVGGSANAPMHGFAGPQRNDTVLAIGILGRHRP
jgi:hypothetical protein